MLSDWNTQPSLPVRTHGQEKTEAIDSPAGEEG